MFTKIFSGIVALVLVQIVTGFVLDIVLDAVLLGLVYMLGKDRIRLPWAQDRRDLWDW